MTRRLLRIVLRLAGRSPGKATRHSPNTVVGFHEYLRRNLKRVLALLPNQPSPLGSGATASPIISSLELNRLAFLLEATAAVPETTDGPSTSLTNPISTRVRVLRQPLTSHQLPEYSDCAALPLTELAAVLGRRLPDTPLTDSGGQPLAGEWVGPASRGVQL